MNGKQNNSLLKYLLMKTKSNDKLPMRINSDTKKLSGLYYKYIEYNPELEKMLEQYNIDKKQYLQVLTMFLRNNNPEEN